MATNIDNKLESWKNKLLDLGKRNRLLNYRETKRSTLKINTPDIFYLWDSLVKNEKPLGFPYYDEDIEQDVIENPPLIETNQNGNDMQRTLRNLRDKAKTAMEEQGINVLYLSFGFLKWTESVSSDCYFNSPIILVPVILTVESISSPYVLSLHEDEIVVNPTLQYKLENDFGITLPEFDEECNLEEYFNKIRKLVSCNKWEAVEETGLSLLSFLKINMYNDLSKHKDKIISNLIVRSISGDATATNSIPEEMINYDFDAKLKPVDVFQVVDADSSQQDAILCAKKGFSFVLQGPPGTGKSQTITNIIAECLADGKKVLFVSEKMAALDVVHRRLTATGLDDFCLVLHSYKANKKAVLEQLATVLNLSKSKATLSDEAYQKLELLQTDKQKLNEYANQIYEIVEPLGKSIYEVNGILANLDSYEEIIFLIDNIGNISAQQYNRYQYLLSNFADTIGKMTDDYALNPWNGAKVSAVTNELRHDIGAKLGKLIPKLQKYSQELEEIFDDISLSDTQTYTGLYKLLELFTVAKQSPIVPTNWIMGDELTPLFDEVSKCETLKNEFLSKKEELSIQYQIIKNVTKEIELSSLENFIDSNNLEQEVETLKNYVNSNSVYFQLNSVSDYNQFEKLYNESKEKTKEFSIVKEKLLSEFEINIINIDYNGIYNRYKTEYNSFFKYFKKCYKSDKKQIQGNYKTIVKKVSDEMVLDALSKLKSLEEYGLWFEDGCDSLKVCFGNLFENEKTDFSQIDSIILASNAIKSSIAILSDLISISKQSEEMETQLTVHYDFLYNGINTEWNNIRKSLSWAVDFRKSVEEYKINHEFVERICSDKVAIEKCGIYETQIQQMIADIDIEFKWFLTLFENQNTIKFIELPALIDRLNKCCNGLYLLEEWIDFRTAKENCQKEGLADYIDKIENLNIPAIQIIPIFKKRFFRLWLDAILPNYPAVLNFRRRNQDNSIEEFSSLDKLQFEIAKARIKSKLINDLPSLDHFTNGVDEISVLKRELSKQRKIMPIRKLFNKIPNLLLTLKPCLMMSPLSVSLFLEADTYLFDTVIFDEASQVCTENAIGAISRGKQVIIAGDSKQLPPTNFFGASLSDVDYDTDDDNEDDDNDNYAYESILDEANLLPERTLLWHYRSRHEHLIAFSNAKIYKNNLITFPSNVEKVADNGVEYVYVKDGYYDRGGKKGNVIEAKKVGELVFEHFKKHPNRSIGIIAFGEVQQQAIDTAIREMRLKNQQYEMLFKEDREEPFFVKNLENVQGDERDTILFSIGYAKNAAGVFRMNFGPLSKAGGERRLNVAITRAKYNVKLVGSILPTDIDLERISSDGPKLLRGYIDFAMNGMSSLTREITESDIVEHDSPFEAAVYNFLDRKGYKLGTQVGCSGYRIDMAVKHPTLNGQYVLGIECDGATYHSARTARERDRLRQDVLENMGWTIYRIWSTDWIKDCVTEGEMLIEVIENALKNYGIDEEETIENNISVEVDNFVSVDEKEVTIEDSINPYGFEKLTPVTFSSLSRNNSGYLELTDCIIAAVNHSFPLHYDLLCKEMAPLYGNEKATVKIRREVDYGLMQLRNKIIRKGDFLFPANYDKIIVRAPNTRKVAYISTEELAEAMFIILRKCVGATQESVCTETARSYGFNRMTQNISDAMNTAFGLLLKQKKVEVVDDKVVIKQ